MATKQPPSGKLRGMNGGTAGKGKLDLKVAARLKGFQKAKEARGKKKKGQPAGTK